ncbi:MAG: hypothetical protein LBU80_03475 [Rikenellaceae bacterium]|jgi:hypothetical protein|nr:hypothetical protein [Rikenellaceae bacterium]
MGCTTKNGPLEVVDLNAHLHTPYSFSAFCSLAQALDMTAAEGVKVAGINDFYSTDGYAEWDEGCRARKLYPLHNIEFISLNAEDQAAGVRVNDPNNPGRTYLSGKGLTSPLKLADPYLSQLKRVRDESNAHVGRMCVKLNEILNEAGLAITLDFKRIATTLTHGSIRERHLAKALRLAVENYSQNDPKRAAETFQKIFGGKALTADPANAAAIENEIRGNLLKAGGAAFVPEDPAAFLPMEQVRQIILKAGGIPTYPFLADDADGGFTDFEGDLEKAAATLKERGFYAVEFITTRNSIDVLEKYAGYLHDQGFAVTFGTEHNTPAMEPVKLTVRGGAPLTEKLRCINYAGACLTAAHQELVRQGLPGYLDENGKANIEKRKDLIEYGDQIIKAAIR